MPESVVPLALPCRFLACHLASDINTLTYINFKIDTTNDSPLTAITAHASLHPERFPTCHLPCAASRANDYGASIRPNI
eukprot:4748283-Amphidinium_carterae.1